MVVSSVVVVVAAETHSPPSPPVAGRRGSGVWSLTLLLLMVATFMSPPPRSGFDTKKVLRLPNAVAFVPISTSRTVDNEKFWWFLVLLSSALEHFVQMK